MDAQVKQNITTFYQNNQVAVDDLANYLGVPPLWLVAVFHFETAGSLDPTTKNSIGAVGLNQMMPGTLAQFGVTPDQFQNGGAAYQMQIMKQFFAPAKGLIKRAGDLYLYNFYPVAIVKNWAMDALIGAKGNMTTRNGVTLDKIYSENPALDFNKDGTITRGGIEQGFESRYDDLVTGSFFFRDLWIDIKTNWIVWLAVIVFVVITLIIILKG